MLERRTSPVIDDDEAENIDVDPFEHELRDGWRPGVDVVTQGVLYVNGHHIAGYGDGQRETNAGQARRTGYHVDFHQEKSPTPVGDHAGRQDADGEQRVEGVDQPLWKTHRSRSFPLFFLQYKFAFFCFKNYTSLETWTGINNSCSWLCVMDQLHPKKKKRKWNQGPVSNEAKDDGVRPFFHAVWLTIR